MNYRLLIFICMISTCFFCVSANTCSQEQAQDINQASFFQSLIKDVSTDGIEYKDGKIIMYITPKLQHIASDGFYTILSAIVSILSMGGTISAYNQKDIKEMIIFASISLFFAYIVSIETPKVYEAITARWINKKPILTISKEGVAYKDGRTISWNNIHEIIEFYVYSSTSSGQSIKDRSLKFLGPTGKEILEISCEHNEFPISFPQAASILSKALEYVKEKRAAY